ncbi:DUF411 domain-containing protein [Jiella pacifica]|uniref:DUF411 domain-containing protein n=1 Tax=Jiella pacifica TaxID=2696469 RepID=A0A6N9T699_9HYPH|nr:DUF411 domain-containing protein [Jiella pacifica]NDW06903.1 DUF411 domain-containing protein [Jiella pacifica]
MQNRTTARMRSACAGAIVALALATFHAEAGEPVTVYASPDCGCCAAWARHVEDAGFDVTVEHLAMAELQGKKRTAGIPPHQASCHTALVGGYAIEGHVPAAEIAKLLDERPQAVGLTVPGMPADAPGMGTGREPYDVLLLRPDGSTEIFASYPK